MSNLPSIVLTPRQVDVLMYLRNTVSTERHLSRRIQIILLAAEGLGNRSIARTLQVDVSTARTWRRRWQDQQEQLTEMEKNKCSDDELLEAVEAILSTASTTTRTSGWRQEPYHYSSHQIAQIIEIAKEDPLRSELDIEFWTMKTLAEEAIRRGIVTHITAQRLSALLRTSPLAKELFEHEESNDSVTS